MNVNILGNRYHCIGVQYNNLPLQLPGIPHRHRRPAPPLTVVDSQQTGGVIDQVAVTFQHTALAILPAYIDHLVRLLQNKK